MVLDNQYLTLVRLGFTPNQAKVYLTLVKLGGSSIRNLAKFSGVHREEIYRKMNELQELGFVEHIFTRPVRFKATPLECVINIMLHRKSEEISELQLETEELLHDFGRSDNRDKLESNGQLTFLIPERRPLLERAKKQVDSLQNCLDSICSWIKGVGWLSNHYIHFMKALNRNVKIRFIIEKSGESRLSRSVEELINNPLFQLRMIKVLPPACLGLYDQKILFLDTSSDTRFVESPVLWSDNSSMIGMAQVYFEKIWNDSLPCS